MIIGSCILPPKEAKILPDNYILRTLTSVNNTRATHVGEYAFYKCSQLSDVYLPKVTEIGGWSFAYCNLTSVTQDNLPVVEHIGKGAFSANTALTSVSLPKVTTIEESAFNGCSNLASATFQSCTLIKSYAFAYVKQYFALHLLADTVCQTRSYTFNSNTIVIYVPSNLVSSYKSSPYWSSYSSRILAEP